jgi:hypothetical protein
MGLSAPRTERQTTSLSHRVFPGEVHFELAAPRVRTVLLLQIHIRRQPLVRAQIGRALEGTERLSRPNYRSCGGFVTSFTSSNVPSATRVEALQARQKVRPKAISKPHSGKSRKQKVESRNRDQGAVKATQSHHKAI